jgi:hypothetical protein
VDPRYLFTEIVLSGLLKTDCKESVKMNFSEALMLSNKISPRLFLCNSESEIEEVFKSSEIKNTLDKIGLLQACMGIKDFSNNPEKEELAPEQQYQDILLIFLEGSWRFLI